MTTPYSQISILLVFLSWISPHWRLFRINKKKEEGNEMKCVHCPEYVMASAAEKESIIFDKIVSTEHPPGELPPWPKICDVPSLLEGVDFNNMFDRYSDERPANFRRFFHFNSIVGKVKLVSTNDHKFTGLFRGANHGVLRFSPLSPVLSEGFLVKYIFGTFIFSFGLKFFRDGMYSGNLLAGDTKKGRDAFIKSRGFFSHPDFNIFSRPLDNMPGIGGETGLLFEEFEKFSGVLSAADVAAYDQQGTQEESPLTPIIVHYRPNADLAAKFGKGQSLDFRTWTTTEEAIPTGTAIYSVWTTVDNTTEAPSLCVDENGIPQADEDGVHMHCPDQRPIKIGDVITTSRFYSSEWVDKWLLFQHTRICPKDQSTCVMDDPSNPPLELTIPATTYAINDSNICVSDEDRDGILDGQKPSCPFGSTPLSNYGGDGETCFPGLNRTVEQTQTKQCPYMNQVSTSILNADLVENQEPNLCGPLARFGMSFVVEPILDIIASFFQLFE